MPSSGPTVVTALINSQETATEYKVKPVNIPPWLGEWLLRPCHLLLGESFFFGDVATEIGCSYTGRFYAYVHVGSIY